jgi:sulfur-oxidizing protein SoxA
MLGRPEETEMFLRPRIASLVLLLAIAQPALALDDTEKELEKYRQMLKADPWSNPGLLDADRGEALWKEKRGPKNVSLEGCDLGKGPGKVEGAFAELPRYFKDADRVMDLEARLVWCMEKLQGFDRKVLLQKPYPGGGRATKEIGSLATYVAHESSGLKFAPRLDHPKEKEALALGEALFFRRGGPMDFACATCHSDQGKRIRLQGLPFLSKPTEARKVVGDWPAYRVSSSHVMTMEHRIYDCFWQMRMPEVDLGSEVPVALTMYLAKMAEGGEINAPGLKR